MTAKAWIGKSLIAIAIGHTIVGLVAFHDVLSILAGEWFFNTITIRQQPIQEAAFWFLFAGFALLIIGGLVDWIERSDVRTPAFLPWGLLSITAVGTVMMPISGFWLLLVPTVGLFRGTGSAISRE